MKKSKGGEFRKLCPMAGCWAESAAKKGGLCNACRSWWQRVQLYSPGELHHYLARLGRFSGRFSNLRNKDRRPLLRVVGGRAS